MAKIYGKNPLKICDKNPLKIRDKNLYITKTFFTFNNTKNLYDHKNLNDLDINKPSKKPKNPTNNLYLYG